MQQGDKKPRAKSGKRIAVHWVASEYVQRGANKACRPTAEQRLADIEQARLIEKLLNGRELKDN